MLEYNIAKLLLFMIIISLNPVLSLCYGEQVSRRIKPMILTMLVGWLITRYCVEYNAFYKIDMLTVHFIVWQISYLMCKWGDFGFQCPVLILRQASCCISTCVDTFLYHEFMFRYLPLQFKIGLLWMLSFYDM
jgi:hypothetical protein